MPGVTVAVGADVVTTSYGGRPSGPGIVPFESLPARGTVSAQANQVASVNQASFLPGTFEFVDFNDARSSGYGFGAYFQLQVGGLRGSGVGQTVFQMRPNTSTRASEIPAQSTGQTVDFALIRVGGSGSTVRNTVVSGFTVKGTPQGHIYNGVTFYIVTNGTVTDCEVLGIPGNASSQPGETFGWNDYRGNGNTYTRLFIDGQNVGASGFGGNVGSNLTMNDCVSKNNPASAGFTCNTYTNITYNRCQALNNGKMGFNFERVGGAVVMNNCVMQGNLTYHVSISSDTVGANYTIVDPVFDGPKLRVKCAGFGSGARKQDPNAITLIVNGVSRPDLMELTIG